MDALRKAEEEKRKAAGLAPEPVPGDISGEFTRGDTSRGARAGESTRTGELSRSGEQSRSGGLTHGGTGDVSAGDLSIDMEYPAPPLGPEHLEPLTSTGELELEPVSGAASGRFASGELRLEDRSMRLDERSLRLAGEALRRKPPEPGVDTTSESARGAGYDQESTLPSARAIQGSLEEYFEGSQSLDTSRFAAYALPPGEQTAMDASLGTPVSAQTVFAARRAPAAARAMNLVIGATVALTVLLGAGGVYWFLRTPAPQVTPSPLVARDIDRPASPEFVVPQIIPQQTAPVLPDASDPLPALAAAAPAPPAPAVPDAAVPPPLEPEVAPGVEAELAEAGPVPAAAEPPAAEPAPAPLVVAPAEIRITRGTGRPAIDAGVSAAYAALTGGDTGRAETLYRETLARQPGHRDALLGLAGLALQRGDSARAYEAYREVLRRHPGDTVAAAAVFALQGYTGPDVSESRLKMLAEGSAQAAYPWFVLGNYYARGQRWAQAEQAYFEAWTRERANPAFALNLAVSLDQLGERDTALDYYRQALEIADRQGATFDNAQVLDRIQALSGATVAP